MSRSGAQPAVDKFASPYVPCADRATFAVSAGQLSNGTDLGNSYRTKHIPCITGFNVRLVYCNSFNNSGPEGDGRNNILVQAAVETPSGTFLAASFNGARSVVIEPGGMAISDPVGAQIVKGTAFFTRTYVTGAGSQFTDGVSNATTTFTSATAAFSQADVGRSIRSTSGTDIPDGTIINAVGSATSITLSAAATTTASAITFVVGRDAAPTATGVTGLKWPLNYNGTGAAIGEGVNAGVNAVMNGSITGTTGNWYGPASIWAIPAVTGQTVIGLIGDSILNGSTDNSNPATAPASPQPNSGYFKRALNGNYCFVEVSLSGASAADWGTSNKRQRRLALLNECTHFYVAMGTNDLSNNAATAQTQLTNLYAFLNQTFKVPIWVGTVPPLTTSSDSWATTANQTVAASESNRTAINDLLRGVPANVTGVFEVADQIETARNSGIWQSVGTGLPAAITTDGKHPNAAGHNQIATASAFNAAALSRAFGPVSQ